MTPWEDIHPWHRKVTPVLYLLCRESEGSPGQRYTLNKIWLSQASCKKRVSMLFFKKKNKIKSVFCCLYGTSAQ